MAKIKGGKPESKLDIPLKGMYNVFITGQHKESGDFSDHSFIISEADSHREAQKKAMSALSPALKVVKITSIFLGAIAVGLILHFMNIF